MQRGFLPNAELAKWLSGRPSVVAELAPAVLSREPGGLWLDLAHPAYRTARDAVHGAPASKGVDGKALIFALWWAWLHGRPAECESPAGEQEQLERKARTLPCGPCKQGWLQLVRDHPPDLSSRIGYARWTWEQHNRVNLQIGKPEFPWEEAVRVYRWDLLPADTLPASSAGPARLDRFFDRVVVLTLKRRADRLALFQANIARADWPFRAPQVAYGLDGSNGTIPCPTDWQQGGGAYGCKLAHQRVLEDALSDGINTLLVMEDDVYFSADFGAKVEQFLANVPDDWDNLMIGGQLFHDSRIKEVAPGVLRVTQCERTHCYALKGRAIRDLYQRWASSHNAHIDWVLGDWQEGHYNVYAPKEFLAGQDTIRSDITGRTEPKRIWRRGGSQTPVVLLRVPAKVVKDLRGHGVHTGHWRDPKTDVDKGLIDLFANTREPDEAKLGRLVQWVKLLRAEAGAVEGGIVGVWHERMTVDLLKRAIGRNPLVVTAQTTEQALEQLAAAFGEAKAA